MGCPKGWLDYEPIGKVVPNTRIVAFKTPLKPELYSESSSDPTQDRFTPHDCIKSVRRCTNGRKRLGLVLNLTFTTKYYNPQDFERSRVHYGAIKCPGHEIPNEDLFWQFQRSLYNFFFDYPDRNMVVGVHCTHGVNRTGYMIARFLIQCEGWDVEEAITTVGDARGYPIERENYIAHLNNLHKPSYLFPKIPTAKDLKEKEDRKGRGCKRNGDASESSSKEVSVVDIPVDNDENCQNSLTSSSIDHQNISAENNHIQSSNYQTLQGTISKSSIVTDEKFTAENESETDKISHGKESETNQISHDILPNTIQSSDDEGFIPLNATGDNHSNSKTESDSKRLRTT